MAIHDVKVPQLSESVAEATLLQWKKKPGEAVTQDETLIEIETDKVVLEVPAPASGVMTEVLKDDGGSVVSNEVIARIDTEAKAGAAPATAKPVPAAAVGSAASGAGASAGIAMPAAAKLMAESGVSVAQGTGKEGRITKGDVLSAMATKPAAAGSAPASITSVSAVSAIPAPPAGSSLPPVSATFGPDAMLEGRPEQRVPMSRLRARVAERLLHLQ
jgi:2-oxoglutarate dehydrogenase E2 component (dihydrolipoamide succinyltransferase)